MAHRWPGDGNRLGSDSGGSSTIVVAPESEGTNDLETDANPHSDLSQEENMSAPSEMTTGTEKTVRMVPQTSKIVTEPESDKKDLIEIISDEKDPSEIEIEIAEEDIPPHVKVEQMDYVLFFAEKDHERAENLHEKLSDMKHRGVLYNDMTCLGYYIASEMGLVSELTKHCTYMLFYVTENFNSRSNVVVEMHKDECLMKTLINPEKRWSLVPVFSKPKSTFQSDDIPYGLLSLNGLTESDQKYFERGAKGLFTAKASVQKKDKRTKTMLEEREKWVQNKIEEEKKKQREMIREQKEIEIIRKQSEKLEKLNEEKRAADLQQRLVEMEISSKQSNEPSGFSEFNHFHSEGAAQLDKNFGNPPPYQENPGPSQPLHSDQQGQTVYNVHIQCSNLGDLHLGNKSSTNYSHGIETDEPTSPSEIEFEQSTPSDDEMDAETLVKTNTPIKQYVTQKSTENGKNELEKTQNGERDNDDEIPYPGYKPEDHNLDIKEEKNMEKCDDVGYKIESEVSGEDEQSFHLSYSEGKSIGAEDHSPEIRVDHSPEIKNMGAKDSCQNRFVASIYSEDNIHQCSDQPDQNSSKRIDMERDSERVLPFSKNSLELENENVNRFEDAKEENFSKSTEKKDYTKTGKSPEGTPV